MKRFALFMTALLGLSACATQFVSNVDSTFYAHNLSAQTIPVKISGILDATDAHPTYWIFLVQNNVVHEGKLIIPAGSKLATMPYFRDTPHIAVDRIQLVGTEAWTPAQGVVTMIDEGNGIATLSHVVIPQVLAENPDRLGNALPTAR
ncbi:MAG: hypothetical protein V1746_07555 [bacterium]